MATATSRLKKGIKIPVSPIAGRAGGARSALVNPIPSQGITDFGPALASIGAGFEALAEVAHADDEKRDGIRAVQVEGAFKRRVEREISALDPLATDYFAKVQDIVNGGRDSAMADGGFLTDSVASNTDKRLTAIGEGVLTLSIGTRQEAIEKNAIAERGQSADAALADIRKDPDGSSLYTDQFNGDLARLSAGINPDNRRAFDEAFSDAALIAKVEGLAAAGRGDEARALAAKEAGQLSPKQNRALKRSIRAIETAARQDLDVENSEELKALELDLINGRAGRDAVEAADVAGLFEGNDTKRLAMERIVVARETKLREIQEEKTLILSKVKSGTGLDTQKEVDIFYGMSVKAAKPRLDLLNEDQREAALLDLGSQVAVETGQLPTPIKRIIENAERVEDADIIARAARYHDQISAAAPGVDTGVGDRGKRVSAAHELLGLSYAEAAAYIVSRTPDAKVLDLRRKQFDVDNPEFNPTEELADVFDVDESQVTAGPRIRYERLLRLEFELSGDPTISRAVAARTMKETFGLTGVGGAEALVLMEHPAESFFPGASNVSLTFEQKTEILNSDVSAVLAAFDIRAPLIEGAEDADLPEFMFVTTDKTRKLLAAGERPEYDIYVLNSFGIPVKLPLSYVMPTTELLMAIPAYNRIAGKALVEAADRRTRNKVDELSPFQGEGPGASSGVQTPGLPSVQPRFPERTLPTQGLPSGAQGVLTGVGGG